MKTDKHGAPDVIYLQLHGDCDPAIEGSLDWDKVCYDDFTWCRDPIFRYDIKYIRADLVSKLLPEETEHA